MNNVAYSSLQIQYLFLFNFLLILTFFLKIPFVFLCVLFAVYNYRVLPLLLQSWDDVERKVKPKEVPYNYRVTQPLNQEKSQLSLAEVYEEEYLKQTAHEGEMEEKEDERHTEIKSLMEKLFLKLDALSNFRYTPKPVG